MEQPPKLSCEDLHAIAAAVQDPETGIKLQTKGITRVKNCFYGRELVDWLYSHVRVGSRQEAVEVGGELVERYVRAVSVKRRDKFYDAKVCYRFINLADDETCDDSSFVDPLDDELQVSSALVDDLLPLLSDGESGVELKDRKYHLRKFTNCFVGSEATTWIAEYLNTTRAKAVEIGQRMVASGFLHHVTNGHDFEDAYLFYCFSACDDSPLPYVPINKFTTVYDFYALDADENVVQLSEFKSQALLIVNVASF